MVRLCDLERILVFWIKNPGHINFTEKIKFLKGTGIDTSLTTIIAKSLPKPGWFLPGFHQTTIWWKFWRYLLINSLWQASSIRSSSLVRTIRIRFSSVLPMLVWINSSQHLSFWPDQNLSFLSFSSFDSEAWASSLRLEERRRESIIFNLWFVSNLGFSA